MKGWGKREIPEKARRPAASSDTIPTCANPGADPPRIEPRWEAGSLTTTPPWPPLIIGGYGTSSCRPSSGDSCLEVRRRQAARWRQVLIRRPAHLSTHRGFIKQAATQGFVPDYLVSISLLYATIQWTFKQCLFILIVNSRTWYGRANGVGRLAKQLHEKVFPDTAQPHHQTFSVWFRRLAETGTLEANTVGLGRAHPQAHSPRSKCQHQASGGYITKTHHIMESTPSAAHVLLPLPTNEGALAPGDHPDPVTFCQWFIGQNSTPGFASSLLFTDEATFGKDGIANFHNNHHGRHHQQIRINVWAGIVCDCLVGPHVLPPRLTGEAYRGFLATVLPQLLKNLPLYARARMWFMHDDATAHFSLPVRVLLDETFHGRWIVPIANAEVLHQHIFEACETIRTQPGIFGRVRRSMIRRVHACSAAHGGHFEYLFWQQQVTGETWDEVGKTLVVFITCRRCEGTSVMHKVSFQCNNSAVMNIQGRWLTDYTWIPFTPTSRGAKRDITEKIRRPAARLPHAKIPEVTRTGNEPSSPMWEASSLTTKPPRPLGWKRIHITEDLANRGFSTAHFEWMTKLQENRNGLTRYWIWRNTGFSLVEVVNGK
ncbi:hypothetical protein PR048_010674 [Dryococelus australis]|uniref:Transposase n=1 Tax=Dryococelus australis TaxID=614101 RepID=A0ABQ9I4I8_9NEOP|nr:hypothetical protein PR048_010674 [Dryococelus australis]